VGQSALVRFGALITAEVFVYHCLNAPANSGYAQYVTETMPLYTGRFWFIAVQNLCYARAGWA